MWLDKNTSVNKEWFENKTREEQIEFVSNIQEYKYLREELKKKKVKAVLDGISFRDTRQASKANGGDTKKRSRKSDTKQQGSNKS
ncbi:hypothetical protein ACJRPK_13840 [Aquimarina sp. 2-A2]|uniref:hypothetical protein n=1 Tax=Aquimarina sp. 2-A2 TaxID=3382644 RepID=UPI00387EF843